LKKLPFDYLTPAPVKVIEIPGIHGEIFEIHIKCGYLNHPEIQGNKLLKLKYNLLHVINGKYRGIITFGGAYSNHIAAVAAASKLCNIPSIGIIRGDETSSVQSHTLDQAQKNGMQLLRISREAYRHKNEAVFLSELLSSYPGYFIIPEGGTNEFAIEGVREIVPEILTQLEFRPDYIICPIGTGGTFAGLLQAGQADIEIIGIPVLKGDWIDGYLVDLLSGFGIKSEKWSLWKEFHFGGYAKTAPELLTFKDDFEQKYDIPLDPVYTAKLMYGVTEKIKSGYFAKGEKIVVLHTGGLQGNIVKPV